MRLKVHQLRIALIVANLILAGSAAAYAFAKYNKLREKPETVKIIDPKTLVMKAEGIQNTDPTAQLRGAPERLIPRKPPEVTDDAPDDPTKDPDNPVDSPTDGNLEPGPLGDHWEYAFYILCEGDPMNSIISLRKKDAAGAQPGPAAAASKAGVRPRSQLRPQRVNLSQRKPAGGVQPAGDSLTFTVGQRLYKNDTVDPPVEFYIHEADRQKFVYWVPADGPQKKYALPRESHSLYIKEPHLGLRPQPPPEGAEEEEGKAKQHFVERPAEWEDRREEEYLRMLNGEPAGPNIQLTGPQEKKEKTGASSKKAVPSFGSGREPRKTFTDDEKEQLREVMKSPKMSDKDRAELRKALMGGKK